ncbi:GntR family transcriptional regulator [Shinella sumterensis]|nr:GntR family transcriptional regulator [Shinella sumterensis]
MSSRYKRRGKSKFIMIEGYVKRSAAWRALSVTARAVYLELKWRYDGSNNGRIGLGERELATELHIGKDTARRALQELVETGFAAKAKPSGFNVKHRAATEWRLTEYSCDVTGELPTKAFMRRNCEKITGASQVRTGASQVRKTSEIEEKIPHRRTSGPVKPDFEDPQAHLRSTYRSTIGRESDAA